MKRNIFMAFMLVLAFTCFADEYDLGNIPETHYGRWIPREFDNTFKKDCNYIKALQNNSTIKAHDILIISKNHIQSDKGFHDGYAIPKSEFKDFILKMNGNIPELTDGNKNEYVLISKSTDDYREIFVNYLDRKSTRLNSSHQISSYAVFCLKKKKLSNSFVPGCYKIWISGFQWL